MNLQWETVQRIRQVLDEQTVPVRHLLVIPHKAWVKIHQAVKSRRYAAKRSWQRGSR